MKKETVFRNDTSDIDLRIVDFLYESNLIERVTGMDALDDAIDAWRFAEANKEKIDLPYILKIHHLLMRNLEPEIAGKLRDGDVWIADQHKRFVSIQLLEEEMKAWLKSCKIRSAVKKSDKVKEDLARKWHVAFENIHPFFDGNGRTGRILFNIHRVLLGLPVMVIDHQTKFEQYYTWFKNKEN